MTDIQILGLIVFATSAICGTILIWKGIDSKREKEIEQRRIDKNTTQSIAKDRTWQLWQNERALRIQSETRERIAKEQLAKERVKTAHLESLLASADIPKDGVRVTWAKQ